MCGIAGWIETGCQMPDRVKTLSAMSRTLERRGPDENGIYINGDTALIHRRLIVIDKENGKQPMSARHGDTTYVIVYNGELYNTDELREELNISAVTATPRSCSKPLSSTENAVPSGSTAFSRSRCSIRATALSFSAATKSA